MWRQIVADLIESAPNPPRFWGFLCIELASGCQRRGTGFWTLPPAGESTMVDWRASASPVPLVVTRPAQPPPRPQDVAALGERLNVIGLLRNARASGIVDAMAARAALAFAQLAYDAQSAPAVCAQVVRAAARARSLTLSLFAVLVTLTARGCDVAATRVIAQLDWHHSATARQAYVRPHSAHSHLTSPLT
jgi:hypothetical protein